jgi:hypothetical protein
MLLVLAEDLWWIGDMGRAGIRDVLHVIGELTNDLAPVLSWPREMLCEIWFGDDRDRRWGDRMFLDGLLQAVSEPSAFLIFTLKLSVKLELVNDLITKFPVEWTADMIWYCKTICEVM